MSHPLYNVYVDYDFDDDDNYDDDAADWKMIGEYEYDDDDRDDDNDDYNKGSNNWWLEYHHQSINQYIYLSIYDSCYNLPHTFPDEYTNRPWYSIVLINRYDKKIL